MKYFKLEIDKQGFVTLGMDTPDKKVNILSTPVLLELADVLKKISQEPGLSGLLFYSQKKDNFIAGADINEINDISTEEDGFNKAGQGKKILACIENFSFPTVAAIHGACMGGGTELALCFDYIISSDSDKTRIALPETQLGILPGFGGCVRLPERVGMLNALDVILTGKPISAKKAKRIGFVSEVVYSGLLIETAYKRLKELADDSKKSSRGKTKNILEKTIPYLPPLRSYVFSAALKKVMKNTKGKYPAPLAVIDLLKEHYSSPREKKFEEESRAFGKLVATPEAGSCINVYKLQERAKKEKGNVLDNVTFDIPPVIGVLGAGIMGGGISQLLSYNRIRVIMKDINNDALTSGLKAADKVFKGALKRRKITPSEKLRLMYNIHPTLDYSHFHNAGFVIEAVVEDMNIKKKVFRELETHVSNDAILASNTSALSVTEMSNVLNHPERMVGFHFFNPVHRMPLVEIILTPYISSRALCAALTLARRLKKVPIIVQDKAGFLVNRLLVPYINEAVYLMKEGNSPELIDRAAEKFGMPMGPLRLLDEVGLDVGYKVAKILENAFGERMKVCELLNELYEAGSLGKKSGKGIYIYDSKNQPAGVNPDLSATLEMLRDEKPAPGKYIKERLINLMVNEAARCLSEDVVNDARVVDTGMIFGTGFPPFRGGLLYYADHTGLESIRQSLRRFSDNGLTRYSPCDYLLNIKKFYNETGI